MAKKKTPGKSGPESSYSARTHPKAAEALASRGLTNPEIAEGMGISLACLKKWRAAHPELDAAILAGKEAVDEQVERSLFERATGYSQEAVKIMTVAGKIAEVPYVERFPPDPTSMIFWLKNRKPHQWRDRQEIEHSGGISVLDMSREEKMARLKELLQSGDVDRA